MLCDFQTLQNVNFKKYHSILNIFGCLYQFFDLHIGVQYFVKRMIADWSLDKRR
ncbi:hypothetical protein VIBNISOn1_1390036 [Vibrio nigripulchritudo SOn1]|uniref:Uncharacterized protein n=1 Tax=Vibrio nigripulchritudo SOn1 TaxID=1238450 RepID=A0AAV2VKD2_9VIBR|nr:hypothetical protein VIBNISOn1_1390036 [Vibrio nigripulchritudo SOn1]